MKYSTHNSRKPIWKRPLILLVLLFLLGGGAYAFAVVNNGDKKDENPSISYDPPTEEEQRAGDEQKDRIVEERENENATVQNNTEKQSANVIVVDADQYDDVIEVRAFISDHVKEGTCSYRFTRGNHVVEKSLPARPDASTTICPSLEVDRSEFPTAGYWQLVVTYESDNAKGSSETKTITIN